MQVSNEQIEVLKEMQGLGMKVSGRAIDNDPRINADANPFAAQSSTEASLLAALDRLAAKLQTYRARSINSSQASLLDALADDVAEEREKVRAVSTGVAPDHSDAGPGFTHHDDSACCPCPCRKGAE